ncbi:nicotinamidase-related amidase [Mitsuaria sp. BK045]|uniref:cysteine hydrolase family protein n=1 Tax=unclassified Roseateles TaxID=2626991 RepID=UPI00160A4341|nr:MULTISPECIES: cysteine hydrolase family protein [unclassified Roseateles]MBB3291496.1 nicotinamidase-related amidase [Mitsuaria sp. BK041]MBB3360713.1 nicotinamidase-related amidase [Mitsuaria sp. BK045]
MTTALLIIDLQRALCVGEYACHDVDAVIGRINDLIAQARDTGTPIVFVQHEEDGWEPLRHGSEGWQLDDRLQARPQDPRVRKTSPDSFHRTELDAVLKGLGVTHLVVCGAQSDFCVDTSTRRALSAGYDVTLVEDGHTTIANGALTAPQIIEHHTLILRHLNSFGPAMSAKPAAEIRFGAA